MLKRLLTSLENPPTWPLVRAEQDREAPVLRYAHAAEVPPVWKEDFLVDWSDQKLYLRLHTATGEQAQAVLAWFQHCLHTSDLFRTEFQEL